MENVQNKTVLITGGGRGIGYNLAEALLHKDAKKIAIVDLPIPSSQEGMTTLQTKFGKDRVIFFPCDITKTEDFKETFKKIVKALNGLDILVNNAGIFNDNMIEQTFNVNVIALIRSSLMALDHMGKHKGGKGGTIVNVASLAGLKPVPNMIIYSTTKHAVIAFSRCLEDFYDKTNVRILTICPGFTKTALTNVSNGFLDIVEKERLPRIQSMLQTCTAVTNAIIDLIQKGKNGSIWAVHDNQQSYPVKIPSFVRE